MTMLRLLRPAGVPLLLVSMSVLLAVAALEVLLRVTHLQPDFFWQLDAEVGATHIPGKRGWLVFRGGRQYVEINSLGYRDRERTIAKPPRTFRVALLGDSFVEAFQVSQSETLAAILERRLNAECSTSDAQYEVLNFGVSGFGTAEELETLRHRVSRFAPDLVVLNLYASNDLYDNSPELGVEQNRLYYSLSDTGKLTRLGFSVRDNAVKQWLRAHSYAYLFVRDHVKTISALRRGLIAVSAMQDQAAPVRPGETDHALAGAQYLRNLPPPVIRAWELTRALIGEMRKQALSQSAAFAVIAIPNKEEILTRHSEANNDALFDFQQSSRRIDQICHDFDLECLQLSDTFDGKRVDDLYFPMDGHWTPQGHAVAATASFKWLIEKNLIACSGRLASTAHAATVPAPRQ
jgi:hypothetical protein